MNYVYQPVTQYNSNIRREYHRHIEADVITMSSISDQNHLIEILLLANNVRFTVSRALSIAVPTVWNSLHDELSDPVLGFDSFRQFLKTILCSLCYSVTSASRGFSDGILLLGTPSSVLIVRPSPGPSLSVCAISIYVLIN